MSGAGVRAVFAGLGDLVPALVAAYGAVVGVVVLVSGWRVLGVRRGWRGRRGGVVPLVGAIAPAVGIAGGYRGQRGRRWSCPWWMAVQGWLIWWRVRSRRGIGVWAGIRRCAETRCVRPVCSPNPWPTARNAITCPGDRVGRWVGAR
jgi:hypothetical protein